MKWIERSLLKASQLLICHYALYKSTFTFTLHKSTFHLQKLYGLNTDLHLDTGNGVSLEKVVKFCYLGEALDADGG